MYATVDDMRIIFERTLIVSVSALLGLRQKDAPDNSSPEIIPLVYCNVATYKSGNFMCVLEAQGITAGKPVPTDFQVEAMQCCHHDARPTMLPDSIVALAVS